MGPINYTASFHVTEPDRPRPPPLRPNIRELVITLFELGREVTSVLDLDELLQKIPQLIARLTKFQAFAVYLLDPRGEELSIAYSVGYPDDVVRTLRVKVGQGLVGAAVAEGQPLLVNDVHADPRYVEAVPGLERRARRAAAPQGARHRRAQPAERHDRAVHRDRRDAAAPVRRARRGRRSRTRGCSSTSASTRARSRRCPRSAASSARSSTSTSC